MDPIRIGLDEICVLGRSSSCHIQLDDPEASTSRKHIEISHSKIGWTVTDLGSRNGTMLNGSKLDANTPTALGHGDAIRLGSWSFRAVLRDQGFDGPESSSTMIHTLNDSNDGTAMVEQVRVEPLANLASQRLAVLLQCADQIHQSESIEDASRVALHAMVESTGFARAAYIVPMEVEGRYETVAFESKNPLENVSAVNFSQSLLESAAKGEMVRLTGSGTGAGTQENFGQSIADLDIHSALCVPVMIEDDAIGFIYLDARGSESAVRHDASAFGRAVGRLLGLTASNLRSKALEIEQHAMQYDLDAAADAQRLLLPPDTGSVGGVSYSMMMRPGRLVAGDLFGVVELDDGRVCVFLGDVSGKGAGAAIMMSTTQSYIHAMLDQTTDLATVVTKLNRHIADRSMGQFVTMWIGIINPGSDGEGADVEFIDAGHGHWMVTRADGDACRPEYGGGVVVGIDPDIEYASEFFTLECGQRMVLFSDGVVEQTLPDSDEEFGLERAGALLRTCSSHQEDVAKLLAQVLEFAQSEHLRDDTTIASVGIDASIF